MRVNLSCLREFCVITNKRVWLFCGVWTSLLIVANYYWGIEQSFVRGLDARLYQFLALFGIYCCAFIVPYYFIITFDKGRACLAPAFWYLLWLSPILFALKVSIVNPMQILVTGVWGEYWVVVTTLPFKLLVVFIALSILNHFIFVPQNFYGINVNNLKWRPYLIMLMIMVPVIAFASTQVDFLNAYPRVKQIAFIASHTDQFFLLSLIYEIGYGIDFVTIELFFRGFLVFAFARYVGAAAILPMAIFYCCIHFGKPLLECISSFFGGLILGMIAYRTQSIIGGLVVHLGIAWMMEIGGYIGNNVLK